MQDLNDLYFFAQVVEHGGFSAAGRALGVPKSRLSRRVSELEDRLGVRLLQRTSRQFSLTEIGRTYYRHCRAMVVEADSAKEAVEHTRAQPQGAVRISCPTALMQSRVGVIITRFLRDYPQVRLSAEVSNRRVDVVEEGFDAAIRVRMPPLEDSGLIVKVLEHHPAWLAASPELVRNMGGLPADPEALASWPSLSQARPGDKFVWPLTNAEGETRHIVHQPRLISDDMNLLHRAALDGIGIVQLPYLTVEGDVDSGDLINVMPDWALPAGIVHAVFPSRRGLVPAVRAFLDALAAGFTQAKEPGISA